MRKKISVITLLACVIGFGGNVFAQEAPRIPNNDNKEIVRVKDSEIPKVVQICKACKPPMMMPHRVRGAFEFFKYADELQLTDEQLIQLRAYYKKYYCNKSIEKPVVPSMPDFCSMTEQELLKFADDESVRIKRELISKFQKIIDLKKILSTEQLQKIKEDAVNERKKFEEITSKRNKLFPGKPNKDEFSKPNKNHSKNKKAKGFRPFMGMPMQPWFGMMQPMQPGYGMFPPMMPMRPRRGIKPPMQPQHGMMPQMMPMQPMCPQYGMMPQMMPMQPMCPQHGMRPQMMPMKPMQPGYGMFPPMMPKKHNGLKKGINGPMKNHHDKNNMVRPPFWGCNDKPKSEPPFAGFLNKLFGCKNNCEFDIMRNSNKEECAER